LLRMDTVPKFIQHIKQVQEELGSGYARVRPPRLEIIGEELEATRAAVRNDMATRPAVAAQSSAFSAIG
jgi:1-pyrroline-4-hydroxy-2-carboxylate deaminase